jgi:endogenous inhibitor of DNA gyrase (YacG/DUF329 family)
MSVNVTKHQLENLYIGQGLTVRQCAAALGLPTSGGISWRLKKFGIPARPQLQVDKLRAAHPRGQHKVMVFCTQCGASLQRYPSLINETNFCNHTCKGEWRRQDLLGQRFGLLTVVMMGEPDRSNHIQWECLCDCGGKKTTRTSDLRSGKVTSCGCLHHPKGIENPNWKGGKIDIKCANPSCRKMKSVYPSQDGIYERRFCDAKCYGKYIASSGIRSGENSPRFIERIKVHCAYCGDTLVRTALNKRLYAKSFCGSVCLGKWVSENNLGENNKNWKGGKSFEPYPTTWTFRLREAIRDRDGRVCQICGKAENGERLAVHHIDYDKKNIAPENLVSLCHDCHCKTNSKRDYWQAFFEEQRDGLKTGTNN